MTEPTTGAAAHAQWNEEMVRKYDPDLFHSHRNPVIRWVEGKRVRVVTNALADCTGPILEVGCGAGNVLARLEGEKLFGVDLSSYLLGKASDRLEGRARLTLGSGEALPYTAGSFDGVLCTEVIEHVLNPKQVMEEIARVLRPGGFLAMSVPNEDLIDRLKGAVSLTGLYRQVFGSRVFESPMENEWHLHRFNRVLLETLVTSAFDLLRVVSIPFATLPLRYVAVMCRRSI